MRMAIVLLVGCATSTPAAKPAAPPPAPVAAEPEPQIEREWLETPEIPSAPREPPTTRVPYNPNAPSQVLDATAIRDTVKRAIRSFNHCYEGYEDARDVAPRAFAFTIGPDGKVSEASTGASPATPFDACMITVMQRLVFPKPADGGSVKVSYPLH